ncbi:hypothetical protein [Rhodococcus sp. UNC363MFTsu5.1]|uniref:hypothetical protein n=1 Tax=Rhodococcus sp. UNC363MFTsu5.1 TaxID=1449069 RepID=UPI00047F9312|nr:hypothetical protein [Rhodococcus sp. UNC363MFTsu5.1]
MKRTLAALALPAALLLAGCSSSTSDATAPPSACPTAKPIENADLAAAVTPVSLPNGATIVAGRVTTMDGGVGVAVDVCAPDVTTADQLRPLATDFAKAVKASPLGATTEAMWVESYQIEGGEAVNDVKVKDGTFKMHLWNGLPSAEAEQARWEVISG